MLSAVNFDLSVQFLLCSGSCLRHVNYSHGCPVSIQLHSLLRQELFMSNHVSAHVRGSGLTDTSWQSDAFVHIKNALHLQRDNSSIVEAALMLTHVLVRWNIWMIRGETFISHQQAYNSRINTRILDSSATFRGNLHQNNTKNTNAYSICVKHHSQLSRLLF